MSFLKSVGRFLIGLSPEPVATNRSPTGSPTRSPDPEFMGEALVYNFLNRFGLKTEQFAEFTADLPPDLKEPAGLWIVLYGCWLFRAALRDKHGEAFQEAALVAARRRLDRKLEHFDGAPFVEALDFWFDKLDDATKNLGMKYQGMEVPFEVFAAWTFLALDADSPFFGKTEIPNQLDLAVADSLEKGKSAVLDIVRFTVELGRPLPSDPQEAATVTETALAEIERSKRDLSWSLDLGPEERRLRRRHGNPLFSPDLRVVTQDDIDAARERDRLNLMALRDDLRLTLDKVFALPDNIPLRDCKPLLDGLDDLKVRLLSHPSSETSNWLEGLDKGIQAMVAMMRGGFAGNEEGLRAFDEWRRHAQSYERLFNNADVLEVMQVPAEDVVPTVCSLSPAGIDSVLRAVFPDSKEADALRANCIAVLRKAVAEGYPVDEATARLSVLGAKQLS